MRKCLILVLAMLVSVVQAQVELGTRVAILSGGDHRHRDEFDGALKRLTSWSADRYNTETAESVAALAANLTRYDMILVCPLINYVKPNDLTIHAGAFRTFVKNGGAICVTDACYSSSWDWLKSIDPSFEIKSQNKDSKKWGGKVIDSVPPSPLRCFPRELNEVATWAVLTLPENSKWEVVARVAPRADDVEAAPLTVVQRYGKGFVYVTAQRQPSAEALQNYRAYLTLCHFGLTASSDAPLTLNAGPNQEMKFNLKNVTDKPVELKVIFAPVPKTPPPESVTIEPGATYEYLNKYSLNAYGSKRFFLALASGIQMEPLVDRMIDLPEGLSVYPHASRGLLSAARRSDTVNFTVAVRPADGTKVESLQVRTRVYDSNDNLIASTQVVAAAEQVIRLPFPHTLPSGDYMAHTELLFGPKEIVWRGLEVETPFEILPLRKAQTVIDQDMTFLVDGKPFFPLGIYHVPAGAVLTNVVESLGINLIQTFSWSGVPAVTAANDLGVKVLWEQNHASAPGAQRDAVRRVGKHPGLFAWYGMDEPYESQYDEARTRMENYHKYDKHHPTYMVSCAPHLFPQHAELADIFAPDPYPLGEGGTSAGSVEMVADWMDKAWAATHRAKPVICVPQSFGKEPLDKFRCMAYLAVTHDARGIIWYPWSQAGGGKIGIGIANNLEQQKLLKQIIAEFKEITPALVAHERRMFKSTDNKVHALLCREEGDNYTLVLVNGKDEKIEATLEIPELTGVKKVTKAFEKGEATPDGEKLILSFAPYQTAVYRWKK